MRTEIINGVARDREALMGSMEEFVHYANLIFVKRQLADPSITDEQRRMLATLVALEEAKRFHEMNDRSRWTLVRDSSINFLHSRSAILPPVNDHASSAAPA